MLVDGQSFDGYLETLSVLEKLFNYGIPTHIVRKGDDIPAALSMRQTVTGPVELERLEEVISTS